MHFDAVFDGDLFTAPEQAKRAEQMGFDTLWVPESKHDPFLSLLRAAEGSEKLNLGTAIAVALARNPMSMAYPAWDLHRFSKGRLWLGLGSQVKAHITKRFSMPWDKPIEQMRDYVAALRAIFHAFQTGEPLKYQGPYYKHTLMTPFFNPGPMEQPFIHIPIGIAAVGPRMSELAGECADFLSGHPFTNRAYVEKITLPSLEAGLKKSGRQRKDVQVVGNVFVITGDEKTQTFLERKVRESIAFYGSTPAYAEVLEVIGRGDLHRELHKLSREGRWAEMAKLIPEEVVACCSVRATMDKVKSEVQRQYGDLYDRVVLAPSGIES